MRALAALGALSLIAVSGTAAAMDCAPQAHVVGPDRGEVQRMVAHLRALGVTAWADGGGEDESEWGCPEATVKVGRRNNQVRLIVRDPAGQTYRRDVDQYATAAALIESWIRSSAVTPLPVVTPPATWWIRASLGAVAGNGDGWGSGPALGVSRALGSVLRAEVDARAALGAIEAPTVAFSLEPARVTRDALHAMLEATAGLSAFTRGSVVVGLGVAGGARGTLGAIEGLVPLIEGKVMVLIPASEAVRVEVSMLVQGTAAYGPFVDGRTTLTTRLNLGLVWGID